MGVCCLDGGNGAMRGRYASYLVNKTLKEFKGHGMTLSHSIMIIIDIVQLK